MNNDVVDEDDDSDFSVTSFEGSRNSSGTNLRYNNFFYRLIRALEQTLGITLYHFLRFWE